MYDVLYVNVFYCIILLSGLCFALLRFVLQ